MDRQLELSEKRHQALSWGPRHSTSRPRTNHPHQDQQQRGRQARSENLDQVPFNESEWAVNALLRLLQHPDLRFGINTLLVDTLLGGVVCPSLWTLRDDLEPLEASSIQVKTLKYDRETQVFSTHRSVGICVEG